MRLSDNLYSASLTTASSLTFVINDGLMKWLLVDYGLFETLFLRGLLCLPMLALLCIYMRQFIVRLNRRDSMLVMGRMLSEVGLTYCLLTAVQQMPLASLTALLQSSPLFLSLVAFMFFGERFRWRRWVALGLGYLGVLIIIRPSEAVPLSAALYGLLAVGFIVSRDSLARLMSAEVPTLFPALMNVMGVMIFGGLLMESVPTSLPDPLTIFVFIAAAATIILGNLLVVEMMRKGDIGFVSLFRYSAIIFSVIFGYMLFDEWPDMLTFAGSALVIGAGLYSFYRERHIASG